MTWKNEWRLSKKWGYVSSAALIPYAVIKMLWANGIIFLASGKGIAELHASMKTENDPISRFFYSYGIDVTAVLALIASLLALALVRDWRSNRLRWVLIAAAGLGGSVFVTICLITFYKLVAGSIRFSDFPEFDPWVLLPVYGGFLVWGVAICMAALSCSIRTYRRTHQNGYDAKTPTVR
ncbi:hypothetical protein [Paenibacillus humicola]|uniref:hypothetical protein n=1 Tax=Paenibacillus humicola TaxID=3110540 RepID=UPI00237AFFD0|nr:hypothetical protein [Paenibacillus humicola]